jgi:hypothetical protein
MEENFIEMVDRKKIKLPSGLYAMIHNGRMVIMDKAEKFASGYNALVYLSFDDFEELKKLGNSDEARVY